MRARLTAGGLSLKTALLGMAVVVAVNIAGVVNSFAVRRAVNLDGSARGAMMMQMMVAAYRAHAGSRAASMMMMVMMLAAARGGDLGPRLMRKATRRGGGDMVMRMTMVRHNANVTLHVTGFRLFGAAYTKGRSALTAARWRRF